MHAIPIYRCGAADAPGVRRILAVVEKESKY
jgi:hypothetical protein